MSRWSVFFVIAAREWQRRRLRNVWDDLDEVFGTEVLEMPPPRITCAVVAHWTRVRENEVDVLSPFAQQWCSHAQESVRGAPC
eukprot:9322712-Pyramimonas_sp.AAC.1